MCNVRVRLGVYSVVERVMVLLLLVLGSSAQYTPRGANEAWCTLGVDKAMAKLLLAVF